MGARAHCGGSGAAGPSCPFFFFYFAVDVVERMHRLRWGNCSGWDALVGFIFHAI